MKVCLGFSHGWLALEYDNKAIKLVNPFKYSVAPISLPPLSIPIRLRCLLTRLQALVIMWLQRFTIGVVSLSKEQANHFGFV